MLFDHHIIEQVITLWNRADRHRSGLRFAHVKTAMETVFLAGLKREEDRPVQVSVALLEPDFEIEHGNPGDNVEMRLSTRLPFTVDSMVKLAPAYDPTTTSIVVSVNPDDAQTLEIWGAVFSSRRGRTRFDAEPFKQSPPEALIISTMKTGSLAVFRGGSVIARFNAGRFSEPTPTPFTSSLIGWSLLRGVKAQDEFRRSGIHYWELYRDFIDRLLVECSRRGHGGTVVWLPTDRMFPALDWINQKYVMHETQEGAPLLEELCHLEALKQQTEIANQRGEEGANVLVLSQTIHEVKRRIVEHVEMLAQLTRVDGALIINDRLQPLSFGSILEAPPWTGKTLYGPDNDGYPTFHVDLLQYGTRHNSAVSFIGRNPETVAFVLSQDGPVAGITGKDKDALYWWPDCLSNLWAV
ncbi:putative sensor domain DACNV-containing protein [Magnetococcus sp. PR-3]|uniref:putative sensor domain DACNV-containing protein n=1 Tax=Magnetococcus sp. PR-3 TaxID=3120355 RepID=UPI002FCE18C8